MHPEGQEEESNTEFCGENFKTKMETGHIETDIR
jgi:hypothetical protein